jgi:hypothetical protein
VTDRRRRRLSALSYPAGVHPTAIRSDYDPGPKTRRQTENAPFPPENWHPRGHTKYCINWRQIFIPAWSQSQYGSGFLALFPQKTPLSKNPDFGGFCQKPPFLAIFRVFPVFRPKVPKCRKMRGKLPMQFW